MKTKDVGLRIRVERELRDGFLEACRAQDYPAAQVLRKFMRDYVSANASADDGEAVRKGRRKHGQKEKHTESRRGLRKQGSVQSR